MRQKAHEELIERYKKLIPTIKYKKNKDVDEFGANDCVICMEEFTNGIQIKRPGKKKTELYSTELFMHFPSVFFN